MSVFHGELISPVASVQINWKTRTALIKDRDNYYFGADELFKWATLMAKRG